MAKTEPGEWLPEDLAFFSGICQLSGIIICRAMVEEKQRLVAVEHERARTGDCMRDSIIKALGISVIEEQLSSPAKPAANSLESNLSPREKDVLREVATRASNREIAQSLFRSEGTVKMMLQNILAKMNMRNRVEAAVYAVETGLASGQPSAKP